MAEARAAKLPTASAARSSAFMGWPIRTHGCEYDALTDVNQPRGAITGVNKTQPRTLGERLKFAREAAKISQIELAKRVKTSPGSIGNYESNTRRSAKKVAEIAAALGVRALWLESGTGPMKDSSGTPALPHLSGEDLPSVAQEVSHRTPIIPPRTISWEDLVSEKIEGQFLMAIVGDALAPDYLPGQMGIWQAGDTAKNGQPVLIRLPDDQFELRFYEGRGKAWAGVSERKGHRPLSPDEDGAEIVARLRYVDLD